MTTTLLQGDCRDHLALMPAGGVQCVITSPPYFGLRRYTDDPREIGTEATPAEYAAALVAVFGQVWRVLADDGTLWLNLGDCYANDTKWGGSTSGKHATGLHGATYIGRVRTNTGLPSKSLMGIPWRVAFALQDAGWVLRSDIVWNKPNAMPESVTDRPTRSHEYLFLFSKQPRYYYDADAIKEPAVNGDARQPLTHRNKRTVWTIPTQGLRDAHYAPMPEALVEPCILAGSRPGDTVLDPFMGSGTVARVALKHQRHAIGIDLGYQDLQAKRTDGVQVALL